VIKKIAWVTMTFLAILVAIYSGRGIVVPAIRPDLLQNLFDTVPIVVTVHLVGGIVAILVGAFHLNSRLRARFLGAHRWFGGLYLTAVVISSLGGFVLAFNSDGGLVAHAGFGTLATLWLFSTLTSGISERATGSPIVPGCYAVTL
jgi:predicted ferric reductase